MSVEYKAVANFKGQLSKYSGIISKVFKKPKQRLIKEMLYGIQASKDVKLSNIARTLNEDQMLIKTPVCVPACALHADRRSRTGREDRLSRNLG